MSNITTELKFCVNCKWCFDPVFGERRCVHPQVNVGKATYLASGYIRDAQLAIVARSGSFEPCGAVGTLYEEKP